MRPSTTQPSSRGFGNLAEQSLPAGLTAASLLGSFDERKDPEWVLCGHTAEPIARRGLKESAAAVRPEFRCEALLLRTRHRQIIRQAYPRIASGLLKPLIEILSKARNACAGDVDKFLVLLVVAVRTTEHPAFQAFSQDELLAGEVPVFPSLGTNSRSIAASTGIPNETARRKITELVEAGWLARRGRDLRFTARAYQALAPTREALEHLAVAYWELVSAAIEGEEDRET